MIRILVICVFGEEIMVLWKNGGNQEWIPTNDTTILLRNHKCVVK